MVTMTTQEKWAVYDRTEKASFAVHDASASCELFTKNERKSLLKASYYLAKALEASKRRLRNEDEV